MHLQPVQLPKQKLAKKLRMQHTPRAACLHSKYVFFCCYIVVQYNKYFNQAAPSKCSLCWFTFFAFQAHFKSSSTSSVGTSCTHNPIFDIVYQWRWSETGFSNLSGQITGQLHNAELTHLGPVKCRTNWLGSSQMNMNMNINMHKV